MRSVCLLLLVVVLTCWRSLSESTICIVDDLKVEENFDPNKFEGQWFAYMTLTETSLEDITHTYLKDGRGNLDIYLRERIPGRECTYDTMKLEQPNVDTRMNAKMTQVFPNDNRQPFWVMSTDYTSYAVVYGCSDVEIPTGACGTGNVSSWVWVRQVREPLLNATWLIVNTTLTSLCTDPSSYRRVTHNKQGCRQCKPNQWTAQANFDIDQYLGLWYNIMWIPTSIYPPVTDYYLRYIKDDNQVVGKGGAWSASDSKCVTYPDWYLNYTTVPGKMNVVHRSRETYDYWVLEARYDEYAFVLGCLNVTAITGECVQYYGFVWSRTPSISGLIALRLKRLMDQYCLDDSLYSPTDHKHDCSANSGRRQVTSVLWLITFVYALVFCVCDNTL